MSNTNYIESFDPVMNKQLIDQVISSAQGDNLVKLAAASADTIKTELRESSFLRKALPPQPISDSELDRDLKTDRPIKYIDLDTRSRGAVSLPLNISTDTEFYYGRRGVCTFHTVSTPEYTKNIQELRTYKYDIQKEITEKGLNDIEVREDAMAVALWDEIVGPYNGVGASGRQQHFRAGTGTGEDPLIAGGLNKDTYVEMKKKMKSFRLPLGKMIMNVNTAMEFEKFDILSLGNDYTGKIFKEGLKGIGSAEIGGVQHIYTIKDDLVADGIIYILTEPNYLGRFYVLDDVKTYLERDKDILKIQHAETIGVHFSNVAGIIKIDLNLENQA